MDKNCVRCNIDKPLSEFYRVGKNKDVPSSYCKSCAKAAAKKWRNDNLDKHKTLCKKWEKNNRDKKRAWSLKWHKQNPDTSCMLASKYRAAKKNAIPKWANSEWESFATKEIYELANIRSLLTGVKFQVDHIVPLQSSKVQGLHCVANLQILESTTNISKGNRVWPDMP